MTGTAKVVINGQQILLTPDLSLGTGREGSVYRHPRDPGLVIKILHAPDQHFRHKLKAMLRNPLRAPDIAWPLKRVLSADAKRIIGCTMPFAAQKWPIVCAYSSVPNTRWVHADYRFRLLVAKNLASAVAKVHQHACVIGDLSETNVFVGKDGTVALIDVDSYQVKGNGRVYRCCVGTPEYTPAEHHLVDFSTVDRLPQSDAFGLGCLTFQLLVGPGNHSFAATCQGSGKPLTVVERIELGIWAYSGDHPDYVPRTAAPFDLLHPVLQPLVERCFVDGHVDPLKRPLPAEWVSALVEVQQDTDFVTHVAPQLETAAHAKHAAAVAKSLQTHVHAPRAGSRVGKRAQWTSRGSKLPSPGKRRFRFAAPKLTTLWIVALVAAALAATVVAWVLLHRVLNSVYLHKRGEHTLPTPALYQAIADQGVPLPRYRSMFPEFDSSQTVSQQPLQEKTK